MSLGSVRLLGFGKRPAVSTATRIFVDAGVLVATAPDPKAFNSSVAMDFATAVLTAPDPLPKVIAPTWSNGYAVQMRARMRSAANKSGADLTDYILRFSETRQEFRTIANGGYVVSSAGDDIAFTSTIDATYAYDLISYNGATGAIVADVRIPTYLGSGQTPFYVYLGKVVSVPGETPGSVVSGPASQGRTDTTNYNVADPQAVYGLSGINLPSDANLAPLAPPFDFTATETVTTTLAAVDAVVDPEASAITLTGVSLISGGPATVAISSNQVQVTPGAGSASAASEFVKVATTVAFTRTAANIIRPSITTTARNAITVAANQTIDVRDRTVTQHGSGQSRYTPFVLQSCPGGVVIAGGETVGQQSDTLLWRLMKSGPAPGAGGDTSWDDNACDSISPSGSQTWENMRLEKAQDAINGFSETGNHAINVRGCYVKSCRDDCIENDHLKPLLVEDCLIDSTHMFISQRPDNATVDSDPVFWADTSNVTTIRNCLVRLRRQPYDVDSGGDTIPNGTKFDGPWNSLADPGNLISPSGTGSGYAHGWLWKWHDQTNGPSTSTLRVDVRDCLFVVESKGTSTTTSGGWPPGTYSNVTVIWLGPGVWPYDTPSGVTVLSGGSNIALWNSERSIWLRAHGCTDGQGDSFAFTTATPSTTQTTPGEIVLRYTFQDAGGKTGSGRAYGAVSPVTVTPPSSLDSDLAFNGLMLGAACHEGGVGDLKIRNYSAGVRQCAVVMYLEHLDPIVAICYENRYDHFPLGSTAGGYSDKTVVRTSGGAYRAAASGDTTSNITIVQAAQGGDIRWRVAKVTSAETSIGTLAFGSFVGQTDRIIRTAVASSWATEWARSGGTGSVPEAYNSNSFAQYPTIWFTNGSGTLLPIDPVAQGWAIGDRIAFVVDNNATDSSSNDLAPDLSGNNRWSGGSRWSGINFSFLRNRPDANRSSHVYGKNVGCWWNSYGYETEYYPPLLIGHRGTDGIMHVKGNAYTGYAGDEYYQLSGTARVRQVIKIPDVAGWAGRTIRAVDASIYRGTSGTTGSVTLALRRAGATPGAATNTGTLIDSVSINASDLRFSDLRGLGSSGESAAVPRTGFNPHQTLTLGTPVTVQPGDAFYIELTANGNSYRVGRQLNYVARGSNKGLRACDHQDSTCVYQDATASGNWSTVTAHTGTNNYLHLGVSMHFNG